MAVLVSSIQRVLSGRCGGLFDAAGLDGAAASDDWLDPIASSARELGITLADATTVADADLSGVEQADVSQLVDVAELRALENALGNYTKVDQKIALGEQRLGQLRADLEAAISRKAKLVERKYGIGLGTIAAGVIDLGFAAETGDEEVTE